MAVRVCQIVKMINVRRDPLTNILENTITRRVDELVVAVALTELAAISCADIPVETIAVKLAFLRGSLVRILLRETEARLKKVGSIQNDSLLSRIRHRNLLLKSGAVDLTGQCVFVIRKIVSGTPTIHISSCIGNAVERPGRKINE